jgi:hypothetical protein
MEYEKKKNKRLGKYSTIIDEMKFLSNHFKCFFEVNELSIVVKLMK